MANKRHKNLASIEAKDLGWPPSYRKPFSNRYLIAQLLCQFGHLLGRMVAYELLSVRKIRTRNINPPACSSSFPHHTMGRRGLHQEPACCHHFQVITALSRKLQAVQQRLKVICSLSHIVKFQVDASGISPSSIRRGFGVLSDSHLRYASSSKLSAM